MESTISFRINHPSAFTSQEKHRFLLLLEEQGKVNATKKRVDACALLCFGILKDEIISIGAIKQRTNSDFNSDKSDLEKYRNDFNLELGYCYTKESHRGKGYSSMIAKQLINAIGNINLMATTELSEKNTMKIILKKNGFKQYGKTWKSIKHEGTLGLFLKFKV